MTTEAITPFEQYTVQGTGPYAIRWPYGQGDITASVILAGVETPLLATLDFTVSPSAGDSGDLTLSAGAAADFAGGTILITRATEAEQGWLAQTARETGLMAQLDKMTRVLQDVKERMRRALIATFPVGTVALEEGRALVYQDGALIAGPTATDIAEAGANAATATAAATSAAASAALAADIRQNILDADRGAWAQGIDYVPADIVQDGGSTYLCISPHTSLALTNRPGLGSGWASRWKVLAAKGAPGAGTGDVVAANAGSEYVSVAGAFRNSVSAMLRAITKRTGLDLETDTTIDSTIYNSDGTNTGGPAGNADGDSFVSAKIDESTYNFLWFGHARAWLGRRVADANSWVELATKPYVDTYLGMAQFTSRFASGTNGAAFPTGAAAALVLNTTDRSAQGITLSGGRLVFGNAGTYRIEAFVSMMNSSGGGRAAQVLMHNVTQAAEIDRGQSTLIANGSAQTLVVSAIADIEAGDEVELRGIANGGSVLNGRAASLGQEVFNIVRITRLG